MTLETPTRLRDSGNGRTVRNILEVASFHVAVGGECSEVIIYVAIILWWLTTIVRIILILILIIIIIIIIIMNYYHCYHCHSFLLLA